MLHMCHGCVYTGSFEPEYPRTLLGALHVHRIEIPYRAFNFLERVSPRILPLESVDYFGTTDHFSGRKKKKRIILISKTSRFTGKLGLRIEELGIEDLLRT